MAETMLWWLIYATMVTFAASRHIGRQGAVISHASTLYRHRNNFQGLPRPSAWSYHGGQVGRCDQLAFELLTDKRSPTVLIESTMLQQAGKTSLTKRRASAVLHLHAVTQRFGTRPNRDDSSRTRS